MKTPLLSHSVKRENSGSTTKERTGHREPGPQRGLWCPPPSLPPWPRGLPAWDSSLSIAYHGVASGMSPTGCIQGPQGAMLCPPALSPGLHPLWPVQILLLFQVHPPSRCPPLGSLPVVSFLCAPGLSSLKLQCLRTAVWGS